MQDKAAGKPAAFLFALKSVRRLNETNVVRYATAAHPTARGKWRRSSWRPLAALGTSLVHLRSKVVMALASRGIWKRFCIDGKV